MKNYIILYANIKRVYKMLKVEKKIKIRIIRLIRIDRYI